MLLQSLSCCSPMKVTALCLGRTTFTPRTPLTRGSPCYHQAATCQREALEISASVPSQQMVRLVIDLGEYPKDGVASLSSSSLLLLNGGLIPLRWLSLQWSGCCLSSEYHFPQTNSRHTVSEHSCLVRCARSHRGGSDTHSPLYISNTTRGSDRGDDQQSGTSFPPMYRSDITAWALTAAGLSRSYASTVVRVPGLLVDAPANPVVTLVSLDAGVLVVTLSFHDKFADLKACGALAGNVAQSQSWKQMGSLSVLPPLSNTDLM